MPESFGRDRRLTRRMEFLRAYANGKVFATPWFVCYVVESAGCQLPARLGLTASRKVGKACQRNRYKRWAREVFRRQRIRQGVEVVLRFRPAVADAGFKAFQKALQGTLERAGVLSDKPAEGESQSENLRRRP
ncbi:MAG: ribonuclease P protein component [Candidatus Sumerlaeia bacterium]|nr:ribonuclease P protein component [Candidatus Sumerlaeia bacterium]